MSQTGFQKTHRMGGETTVQEPPTREPLNVNTEAAGSLAVAPPVHHGELVDDRGDRDAFSLLEKASSLVAKFTETADQRVELVEAEMSALMSGEMSIDQLAAKYGEMSVSEADALKHQLSRVMNSIEVAIEKTLVERKGIELQKERTFTVLAGLKAAFQIQAETEKVADARDEALYQGDVRAQKNVTRNQDIDYRIGWNQLDAQDKADRLNHKSQMNDFDAKIRAAIRRGAEARLTLQNFKADRQVTATDRIMGKIEQKTKAKKAKAGAK